MSTMELMHESPAVRAAAPNLNELDGLSQPFLLNGFTVKDFVLPEDARPLVPHDKYADAELFPVVDMSKVCDEESRKETIKKLADAAEKWGFFKVVNHGVPMDLIRNNLDRFKAVFTRPIEEKSKIGQFPGTFFGYRDGTSHVPNRTPSWFESVSFPWSTDDFLQMAKRVWPDDDGHIRGDAIKYLDYMEVLSLQLLELLTEGLGLQPNHISEHYNRQTPSMLRLSHYPPCSRPDLAAGLFSHTDPQTLTVVYQGYGGLQLLKDGKWWGVPPTTESLIVNIGDSLQAWSNGRYKSVRHRVVLNPTTSRYSMIFFLNPTEETVIAPVPELTDGARPPKYRSFTWREYRDIIGRATDKEEYLHRLHQFEI